MLDVKSAIPSQIFSKVTDRYPALWSGDEMVPHKIQQQVRQKICGSSQQAEKMEVVEIADKAEDFQHQNKEDTSPLPVILCLEWDHITEKRILIE